jgi:hypothetical protein
MIPLVAPAAYPDINGHFDPMVLASAYTVDDVDNPLLDLFSQNQWEQGKPPPNLGSSEDVLALFANRHEHEHFVRHTSSELGLFVTLLLQFRFHTAMEATSHPDKRLRPALTALFLGLDRLAGIIIAGRPAKQAEAVRLANAVMALFDLPGPAFKTSEPDAPATLMGYGYTQFLEATAVLNEFGVCMTMGLPPSKWNELLRIHERDYHLYFALATQSYDVCREVLPLTHMVVRKSIDGRIPFIGSPYRGPVEWRFVSPSLRWAQIVRDMDAAFRNPQFAELPEHGRSVLATIDIQTSFLRSMEAFDSEYGHSREPEVLEYPVSLAMWRDSISEMGKDLFEHTSAMTWPVLSHLCDSFLRFREWRTTTPLALYSNNLLATEDDEIPNFRVFEAASSIFTIRGGRFTSRYLDSKPQEVLKAFQYYVVSKVYAGVWSGATDDDIQSGIRRLVVEDDPVRELLETSMQQALDYGRRGVKPRAMTG